MHNYVETFQCNGRYMKVKKIIILISYLKSFAVAPLSVNDLKTRLWPKGVFS